MSCGNARQTHGRRGNARMIMAA